MGKSSSINRIIYQCQLCNHFFAVHYVEFKGSCTEGQTIKASCEKCKKPTDCTVLSIRYDEAFDLGPEVRALFR